MTLKREGSAVRVGERWQPVVTLADKTINRVRHEVTQPDGQTKLVPLLVDTREEAKAILERVADSGARLCFVAMGAPRQEEFAALGRKQVPEIGFASIGAGLDFFAGTQKRAPAWAQKLQVEWLWRMLSNPRRLALRYLKCMAILPGHMARAVMLRFQKG